VSNILVVGKGFVGDAVGFTLSKFHIVHYHDPDKGDHYDMDHLNDLDGVVLCLPTPSHEDGACDDSLVIDYYETIRVVRKELPILIKSTTSIKTLNMLQCECDQYLTFSPEFLVASRAREDMVNAPFYIYSSVNPNTSQFWSDIFLNCVKNGTNTVFCNSMVEAGFVKYAINSFLATKVTFMNELYNLFSSYTNGMGNFNEVVEMMSMDHRIGSSHMQVPGPDGKFGWGGACFPKDTLEFVQFGQDTCEPLNVLESARTANRSHRNNA